MNCLAGFNASLTSQEDADVAVRAIPELIALLNDDDQVNVNQLSFNIMITPSL